MNITRVETKRIDGVWHAHLDHHLLGPIDGRSGTEQMAISNLLAEMRRKCQAFNTQRYAELRAKYPEHDWSVGA